MNVFVSGGSRGIGRSIVLKFVSEGWGAAFTYTENSQAAEETIELARKINPELPVRAYKLNLQVAEEIEAVCEQVIKDFTDIAAVVNNAAIVRDNAAVLMSNKEWEDVITVNLTGAFYVSRAFLMHFLSNRSGRFVHISSLSAAGSSGQINYAAAKAGLEGMSLTLAKEYGKKGINSNIVTVGYVPTDMTKNHMANMLQEYWVKHCPAHRPGKPEEIASAVYFLCCEESAFISGENLKIAAALTYAP